MTPFRSAALVSAGLIAAATLTLILRPVAAQNRAHTANDKPEDAIAFQLSDVGPRTGLTIYNAAEHTLYVYQNVAEGNAHINCA